MTLWAVRAIKTVHSFCMFFFVFSTMLLHQVFGNIGLVPTEDIDRHNNFRTFLSGLLLLFRQDISLAP